MAERSGSLSGTYRCPVCGHRDTAEVRRGEASGLVSCSYCETALEVTPRAPDEMRLMAQVAQERASR